MPYMYFIKQVCSIKFPLWAVHYKGYKTNVYKNNEIFMESYNFLCIVFFSFLVFLSDYKSYTLIQSSENLPIRFLTT